MKTTRRRLLVLALVAGLLVPCAIYARFVVARNYRRSQAAYHAFQARQKQQALAEAQVQRNAQTVTALRAAVEAHPQDIHARWRLAQALQQFGLIREALTQLQEIARLDPSSVEAAVGVANSRLYLQRYSSAEQAYRRVVKRWPKNIEGWQGLAASLYHQRLYNDAGAASRQALLLDSHDFGSRYIAASSAIETALEFPNEPETQPILATARKLLVEMTQQDPGNGDLQYKLGLTLFLAHDTKGSLPYLRRAATLLPDRGSVIYDLAEILMSVGNYTEARDLLLRSIPRMPKLAGLYNLLSESYQYDTDKNAIQAAIRASQTATQLAPNTPSYWDRLALSELRGQDLDKARQAFEKSVVLDPNRSYPYQQLAALYSRINQPQRASAAARMAARMEANDESLRHVESLSAQYPGDTNLLLVRAQRYQDLKRYGQARDLYRQILTMQPDNAPATKGLAIVAKVWPQGVGLK